MTMPAPTKLLRYRLPPGKLGINIQEAADGTCLVVSRDNDASPLQVGDVIQSLDGRAFAPRRKAEWVDVIRTSSNSLNRTVTVLRKQNIPIARSIHAGSQRVGGGIGAATGSGHPGVVRGSLVSATDLAYATSPYNPATMSAGTSETEAQRKLREMEEVRGGARNKKEEGDRQTKEEAERMKTENGLLATTMAKVQTLEDVKSILEKELQLKTEQCKALETSIDGMKSDLGHVKGMLNEQKETAAKLEREVIIKNDLNASLQGECENLRQQLVESKQSEQESQEVLRLLDTVEQLRGELSAANKTEVSMQKHTALLEEDKRIIERERDDAKEEAERYKIQTAQLQDQVKEQLVAIDSLVDLLERGQVSV